MKARHLLIADDNAEFRNYVRDVAGMMQYTVHCTGTGREFIAAYEDFDPSHVIVDLVMPDVDGVELLEWLAGRGCGAKVFIVTGYSPDMAKVAERLATASGLSIDGVYPKPIALKDLRALLA
jgi:CheY-like chemotaxis protein